MTEAEKAAALERFKKLEENFVESIYLVLKVSKTEENTRKFFDKCPKKAQQRYADEHISEIMDGLSADGRALRKIVAE